MDQEDGFRISRALLLIGGIVALAFGATELGNAGLISNATAFNVADSLSLAGPLMTVLVGVVALVMANRVKDEPTNIVLAILGFIVGGAGGVIVAVAGIAAIVTKHTLKSPTQS